MHRPALCTIPPIGTYFPCELDSDCPDAYPDNCCRGAARGLPGGCRPRPAPSDCGSAVDPVCGCNGVTYDNECLAESSAVTIAHPGPCGDSGP